MKANSETVHHSVKALLHEKTGIDLGKLDDNASLHYDLAIDSLDIMEVMHELEKSFSIKIEDEDAERIVTVGDLCGFVLKAAA